MLIILVSCAEQANEPVKLPVLTYHSVMPWEYYSPINENNPWILSEEVFYTHMQYLYENGFNAITIEEFLNFFFYDYDLPENPILLTFDDGYLDNALYVYPILKEFNFTAINFLLTDGLARTPQTMTAYPIRYMSRHNIYATNDVFEFASHTHDMHFYIADSPILVTASISDIQTDLRRSFEFPLCSFEVFAYPFGIYSDNAIDALILEGVRVAFTTEWGYITRESDPFRLPRFSIESDWWDMELFSTIVRGDYINE